PISQFAGGGLIGLAVGDFNGDGKLDFATANGIGSGVDVFTGNGDGTFAGPKNIPDSFNNFGLATGDFNGDGRPDLAVANTFGNSVGVLLNNGGKPVAAATMTTLGTSMRSAVVGQAVTLTATVTSFVGTPAGTVTFFDGSTALGSATLDG